MTAPGSLPAWPAILTNQDWQKKKGVIAKIAGRTGVGEAMTDAKRSFDKIDLKVLVLTFAITKPSERVGDRLEDGRRAAQKHARTTVRPASRSLDALAQLARATSAKWKDDSKIPASARKHLTTVASTAESMRDALDTDARQTNAIQRVLGEWDRVAEQAAEKERIRIKNATQQIDVAIGKLADALRKASKNPSPQAWTGNETDGLQAVRSMCNVVYTLEPLRAAYWSTWEAYSKQDWIDACPSGEAGEAYMTKRLAEIAKQLSAFKKGYRKELT